ncbi:KTSC domain-containing protein [Cellulomonas septica]|uniref:KTSC domain-containing protein n=1 Tax=Cellulomonas septica TaxID=285080 RepID=A0ABX1JWP0_9CELL|nr:KTSC domain-containing protein [Cellulomonas septica]
MARVVSDNLHAVGYDSAARTLRVAFRSGGLYDYFNVDESLHRQLLHPHPWRRVGHLVRRHAYVRVRTR